VTSPAIANPQYDLQTVRSGFPIADHITYLNHAAISPLPRPTEQAMLDAAAQLARDPGGFSHPRPGEDDLLATFASTMAHLINAEHRHEIVSIPNTSTGINAVAGAFITAVYVLRAVNRIFLGPQRAGFEDVADARGMEWVTLVVLGGLLIVFGFYPRLLLDSIHVGVGEFLARFGG